jgi:competence protein ComEC
MPALFALLPFAVGILLESYVELSVWWISALFALSLAGAVWLLGQWLKALCAAFVLLFAGWNIALLHNLDSGLPRDREIDMVVRIDGVPDERHRGSVSEGVVERWRSGDGWCEADGDVMLRLWDGSLKEGDRVQLRAKIESEISSMQSYNRLLHYRGFEGRVEIKEGEFQRLEQRGGVSLHTLALRRLERYLRDSVAHATAEAMVVGSRRMMASNVGDDYANTGLMHLMAISGLHLGIIMLLANSLLLPVLLLYRGYLLRALMVIAIVWLFAAISGFTPSVVRSALMLSVFQLSRAVLQRYDSLNVLMVVVIVMLVVDSNYLFDVSFQLSVLAVVGIVVWGVPIMDRMERGEMPGSRFISSLLVSMVAMLWAMPVVAYTFEQVSIMSVIISPIVLVTAYLIVGCGVFALALPLSVAEPFGYAMEYVAELQNWVVASVATWDFANHHLVLSKWCAVVVYPLFVIITLVAWAREQKSVETLSIDE